MQYVRSNYNGHQHYRKKMGMQYIGQNYNGMIWLFVKEDVEVMMEIEQKITVKLELN